MGAVIEVDDKPVRECLRPSTHARTDGRTTRKHNASCPSIGWAEVFTKMMSHTENYSVSAYAINYIRKQNNETGHIVSSKFNTIRYEMLF